MSKQQLYAWQDGSLINWEDATVHLSSYGFMMGTAIYEGIRGYWDDETEELYIFRLSDHIKRLYNSAKICRMGIPFQADELEQACSELLKKDGFKENCYIRPCSYIGSPTYPLGGELSVNVSILAIPRESHLEDKELLAKGLRCNISSWRRVSDSSLPPRSKAHGNYLQYALAVGESKAGGYDVPIHLTMEGKVSEMSGANIFLVRGTNLITPSVTSDILEGITRDTILTLAKDNLEGIEISERTVDRTELYIADEVFECGTGEGEITPVSSIDGIKIGKNGMGEVTNALRKLYSDIVRNRVPKYRSWVVPVYQ